MLERPEIRQGGEADDGVAVERDEELPALRAVEHAAGGRRERGVGHVVAVLAELRDEQRRQGREVVAPGGADHDGGGHPISLSPAPGRRKIARGDDRREDHLQTKPGRVIDPPRLL